MLASGGVGWSVYAGGALIGVGLGAEIELIGYLISRYFGLRAFGAVYGGVFAGFLLGTSGGPFLYARAQEAFGSYNPALYAMVLVMSLVALMFATMGRYSQYAGRFEADLAPAPHR